MKKRLIIGILLLVILTTYKPQNFSLGSKFKIKEVIIENNFILQEQELKKNLIFLYDSNLFFLKTNKIGNILVKKGFIESFEIKKIYPNKIKIKIFEKKPVAIIQNKKNKFYFTTSGDLIKYQNLENYNNLPIVFGNKENFTLLYDKLKQINFSIDKIKRFYYFETKRWDLLTIDNQTIKLPSKNYLLSLKNFINLNSKKDFDKYKIFDYRIDDQLILK